MRQSLSHPEFFNTAFHGSADPELQSLNEFLEQEPSVLENLANSQADMRAALTACPLDWRASWGVLRSDVGEMAPEQRRRNYARILLTCRNNQPRIASGRNARLDDRRATAGMEIWRQLLPVSPRARSKVLNLVGRFLTTEQLVAILPENPLQRIELARLASSQNAPLVADAILSRSTCSTHFEAASFAADWPQVAWCAAQKGTLSAKSTPGNKPFWMMPTTPNWSYELALALQRATLEEPCPIDEDLLIRYPDNPDYQKLKDEAYPQIARTRLWTCCHREPSLCGRLDRPLAPPPLGCWANFHFAAI